jgi:hypothetical protein
LRAAALLACAGCALPAVTAGTFLPAGDLHPGEFHASASIEAGRVLAGPSDVHDLPATPPEAEVWEVSTWVATDVSLRWQAASRLALEAQLKISNPVSPFAPIPVGGAIGARFRIMDRTPEGGLAIEAGLRGVGIAVKQQIDRSKDGRSQTDIWNYRAWGLELPLVFSYRVNPLFAVTGAPFMRAYFIRAWHTEIVGLTESQAALQWSPVLSGGVGGSASFDLGRLEISPGLALELATRPGPGAATHLLFEPGISIGTRF